VEQTEVVVVGGGLIGSSIAWRLAQSGRKVILLERGEPGGEASSAALGGLQPEAGREAGPQLLALWLRSLEQYERFVAELRETTGAAFEYRASGRLVLAFDEREEAALRERFTAQRVAGIPCEWLTGDAARQLEPALSPRVRAALRFPRHGLVDNQRMSPVVATAAARAGVIVRPFEPVLALREVAGRVVGVETTSGKIGADAVVNAAGSWAGLVAGSLRHAVEPAKGEIIALGARVRPVEHVISSTGGSIAARSDGRVIVGATVRHAGYDKTLSADGVGQMLAAATSAIPALSQARFLDAWTGLRPLTPDEQPILGEDERAGLFWATGHYKMGILAAPATAEVIAALVEGKAPPVQVDELSPRRFLAVEAKRDRT
jgi:glycine oxidase